jgi:hypothetical protein|tara:strand:+ start:465 stop:752 length:288 start_codon:yes stop_codon:yes gene_type:complete
MSKRAFTDIREVVVTFDNAAGAMSPDAYKAAINKVEELEGLAFQDPNISDLTNVTTVMTGTSRYRLYSFDLSVKFNLGEYDFIYIETVPNVESLS